MEEKGESSNHGGKSEFEELLGRLNLHEEEAEEFVWEEEAPDPEAKAKWLAIAKVHTSRGFSPSALYADMRSAWNPAKEVAWRKIDDNLFTVQFGCLADWEKAMNMGPWLFRNNYALIMEEYDGFKNPRSIVLDKVAVWVRVMQLPDNYLKEPIIRGMCRQIGEITEVQVKLPAGYIGEFVHIRVKINVANKLFRFVSMTKDKKRDWYQLKYEKLPVFCGACGLLGHWYQECGTGEHEEGKLEWGDFILADAGRGRGRGWTGGRGSSAGRVPGMGRGRGRSFYDNELFSHNSRTADDMEEDDEIPDGVNARKRLTFGGQTGQDDNGDGSGSKVAGLINQLEPGTKEIDANLVTPGKVQALKRSRKDKDIAAQNLSAVSNTGAVREQ
jgi:hypothetical protein